MVDLQKQIQKIKSLEKNFKINELKEFDISE